MLGALPLAPYLTPLAIAGGAIGISLSAWLIRFPKVALATLVATLVIGQTLRFTLPGQGGGILLSDIAVILIILAALLKINHTPKPPYFLLLLVSPFIIWSLGTLLIHIPELGITNLAISAAYWIRLTAHLFLLPALILLFQDKKLRTSATKLFLAATSVVIFLGFIQLALIPNLNLPGWDPHQGRLVSTWLDPNFFGGFLIIVIPWLTVLAMRRRNSRILHTSYFILLSAALASLLLTQSRSSFIALGSSLLIFSPFLIYYWRKNVVAIITISLLLAGFTGLAGLLLGDRALGLLTIDPTATLRLESLKNVWMLAQGNALIGVGYNAYQFAAQRAELISNFSIHSRAGADNSWLTLWVTTGIAGVLLFALPWVYIAALFLRKVIKNRNIYAMAGVISLTALLIHSQFVNSFLYSHLMITMIIIIAITMTKSKIQNPNQ